MTDLHACLIAEAERLGATNVSVEPLGRLKRHPSIVGVLEGKSFVFPCPGSFVDTRRRRQNYITKIRHFLLERGAKLPAKELEEVASAMLRRAARSGVRRRRVPASTAGVSCHQQPPTRLSRDPWAELAPLLATMEPADQGARP